MSIENSSPDVLPKTPDNIKTENVDASINQSPDNVGMVKNIDIVNNAETNTVPKTPEEEEDIKWAKIDAANKAAVASFNLMIEMSQAEIKENATPENIQKVLNNPEKAKSLFGRLATVGKLIEKLGGDLLDKADKGVEAFTAKITELYEQVQANKVEAGLAAVSVVGVAAMFAGLMNAVQINGGETAYIPPEKVAEFAQSMITAGVGVGSFVVSYATLQARNGFFKSSKNKEKMNQQATA